MSESLPEIQLSAPELLQVFNALRPDVIEAVRTDYVHAGELVDLLRTLARDAVEQWAESHDHNDA